MLISNALPRLRRSFAGLSTQRHGIDLSSVHVGFVVDKVAMGQVFLPVIWVSLVSITPPTLHVHSHLYIVIARRTNWRRTGKLPKSSFLSEMGDPWIEKYFHLVSSRLNLEPKVVLKCVITELHRFSTRVVSFNNNVMLLKSSDVATEKRTRGVPEENSLSWIMGRQQWNSS
jgi:hypothetical protein